MSLESYLQFIESKAQLERGSGFDPTFFADKLKPFQRHLVEWSVRKGKSLIMADCGTGKSVCQLTWAQNVVEYTNKPVLVLTPLSVSYQTVMEGEKFGIECVQSRDGKIPTGAKIVVTNYEKLKFFNCNEFGGMVCDESSILKNFEGATTAAVTEFMRTMPYRLLCTATASPNDHQEFGTSSEALGELGYMDMLARFFKSDNGTLHPFRHYPRHSENKPTGLWQFRPHAEEHFWRWLCSWARAVRKPSDLGFDDAGYDLPPLVTRKHVVKSSVLEDGMMFEIPANGLQAQAKEQRRSLVSRCEKAAELLTHDRPGLAWCNLNPEGDLLTKLIPGAVQVSGKEKDEKKEEIFKAFCSGQIRVLVSKAKIAGFGLNFQHCSHQTSFPSHSFEQRYQGLRRLWRFGQVNEVTDDIITTEGGMKIMENIERKEKQAERQYENLIAKMNQSVQIDRAKYGTKEVQIPAWL